jgi:DNA adenine methylase
MNARERQDMKSELPKTCKSPLRWVGGKSRATKTLFQFFPREIHEYREPFLGGGSMAIEFTRRYPDIPVIVSDFDPLVYNFWKVLRDEGAVLLDRLLFAKLNAKDVDGHRKLFEEARAVLSQTISNELESAYAFFIVNKCGFSGLMSGGFSEQASRSNFSVNNIENLAHYTKHIQNWSIQNADANDMLSNHPNTLVYLDPPYARVGKTGKSFLYGKDGDMHKSFDHDRFCASVHAHSSPMLISYDNNELIKSMYSDFYSESFMHTYTLHSGKNYRADESKRKELVLWNYEDQRTSII